MTSSGHTTEIGGGPWFSGGPHHSLQTTECGPGYMYGHDDAAQQVPATELIS